MIVELSFCKPQCKPRYALRDPNVGNGFDRVTFVCGRHLADATACMLHSGSGELSVARTSDYDAPAPLCEWPASTLRQRPPRKTPAPAVPLDHASAT